MNLMKKTVSVLLVAALMASMLSVASFAKTKQAPMDQSIRMAKQAVDEVETDGLYTQTVTDPVLVYYSSQPFTRPAGTVKWALNTVGKENQNSTDGLRDFRLGIGMTIAAYFGVKYLSKTLTTFQNAARDIQNGLETGPDELVEKAGKKAPIVSQVYEQTGPAGKMTLQAVLLPGYLATNVSALTFVLVGGGAALVVIFALTGALSPLIALFEGPQLAHQYVRDMEEMNLAIDAAE